MFLADTQVQDTCLQFLPTAQSAAPLWQDEPAFIEGVRIASLALAAAAAIVSASRDTKREGVPNRWGKVLILIGSIAFMVACINEVNDWKSKSAASTRTKTFQSCEADRLSALANRLNGIVNDLRKIQGTEETTSTTLAGEVTTSEKILGNIVRASSPLFPFKLNLEFSIEAPKADSVTRTILGLSPYDSLLRVAENEVKFPPVASYPPFSISRQKILPLNAIASGGDDGLGALADLACRPSYQVIIQKHPLPLTNLLNPETKVDLRVMTPYFGNPMAALPKCSIGTAYLTNRLAFLRNQNVLAVSQHLTLDKNNSVVDENVITSCLDLVGSTFYFVANMWDVAGLDLKEFYMTSCGRVGTPRKISFSNTDRHLIDRSHVIYSKVLTREDSRGSVKLYF